MNKLVDLHRLCRILIAGAFISASLGLIFLLLDPDVKVFEVNKEVRNLELHEVDFLVMKSPRGTESRVVVFDSKGFKVFTASCDGVADKVCTQENYQGKVHAKRLSLAEDDPGRGILKSGEYLNKFGARVVFENPGFVDQFEEREEAARKRVMSFFYGFLVFGLSAIILNQFKRKVI